MQIWICCSFCCLLLAMSSFHDQKPLLLLQNLSGWHAMVRTALLELCTRTMRERRTPKHQVMGPRAFGWGKIPSRYGTLCKICPGCHLFVSFLICPVCIHCLPSITGVWLLLSIPSAMQESCCNVRLFRVFYLYTGFSFTHISHKIALSSSQWFLLQLVSNEIMHSWIMLMLLLSHWFTSGQMAICMIKRPFWRTSSTRRGKLLARWKNLRSKKHAFRWRPTCDSSHSDLFAQSKISILHCAERRERFEQSSWCS